MTDDQMSEIMGLVRGHQEVSGLDQISWRKTLATLDFGPAMAGLVEAAATQLRILPKHLVPERQQVTAGKYEHAEIGWGLVTEGLRGCSNDTKAFRRVVADTWDPARPETKAIVEMGRDLLPSSGQTLDQCRWSFMRAYNRHAGISKVNPEAKPIAPVLDDGQDDVELLVAETRARRAVGPGTAIFGPVGRRI